MRDLFEEAPLLDVRIVVDLAVAQDGLDRNPGGL